MICAADHHHLVLSHLIKKVEKLPFKFTSNIFCKAFNRFKIKVS